MEWWPQFWWVIQVGPDVLLPLVRVQGAQRAVIQNKERLPRGDWASVNRFFPADYPRHSVTW